MIKRIASITMVGLGVFFPAVAASIGDDVTLTADAAMGPTTGVVWVRRATR